MQVRQLGTSPDTPCWTLVLEDGGWAGHSLQALVGSLGGGTCIPESWHTTARGMNLAFSYTRFGWAVCYTQAAAALQPKHINYLEVAWQASQLEIQPTSHTMQ